jgi:hypothetical protein
VLNGRSIRSRRLTIPLSIFWDLTSLLSPSTSINTRVYRYCELQVYNVGIYIEFLINVRYQKKHQSSVISSCERHLNTRHIYNSFQSFNYVQKKTADALHKKKIVSISVSLRWWFNACVWREPQIKLRRRWASSVFMTHNSSIYFFKPQLFYQKTRKVILCGELQAFSFFTLLELTL